VVHQLIDKFYKAIERTLLRNIKKKEELTDVTSAGLRAFFDNIVQRD
jgi:hypothetical protein